jgi:hypothetical protein
LLFVAPPASALALAIQPERAGRRSGRTAVMVSGLLLLATLLLMLLLGWIGLVAIAVAALLVCVVLRPGHKPSPPGPGGIQRESRSPATTAKSRHGAPR